MDDAFIRHYWEGTWVVADEIPRTDGRKTQQWTISSSRGEELGVVAWFGRWRRFAFSPAPDTVFDEVCMRELSDFCEGRTKARRLERERERQT